MSTQGPGDLRASDVVRYCRELGWSDPPELAAARPGRPVKAPVRTTARATSGPAPAASLDELAALAATCELCRLAGSRKRVVFGEGDRHASLLLVGEAPGAEEDRSGRPFVGQAGQLLDAMIFALGLERRQVYITNVLKCRPPGNRDPQPDEAAACAPLLHRQIELIKPRVVLALGKPAADLLTGTTRPISARRGHWGSYRGIPLMATFHPAYLLRNPEDKALVWHDLQQVRERLCQPAGTSTSTG